MTTPSEIAELVRRTAPVESVEEQPGHLVVKGPLDDDALRAAWLALRAAPPGFVTAVAITDADIDAPLAEGEVPPRGTRFRIVVQTATVEGQLRLYLSRSLPDQVAELAGAEHVLVADMEPGQTFTTYRSRFQLWTADPPEPFAPSEPLPDPRTFVTDFTGEGHVPQDIRPWLLRGGPTAEGPAFLAWRALAARRLLASLADRVAKDDAGVLAYHFSGPPSCAAALTDTQATALFPRLQAGAEWAYREVREAATRHLLLAAEWARTYRRGSPEELGDGSLASAEAAWAAHVKSGSRETLKALAELRRAVIDETQKIAQRAQDLAGAMWKDLAVAAAPFVLKILPDATRASSRSLAAGMALAAAAFLIFSFLVQIYINKRHFRHQKAARNVWKRALNVALTPREVEDFSDIPIRESLKDYRRVRLAVGVVYAALVGTLLWFTYANLCPAPAMHVAPAEAAAPADKTPEQDADATTRPPTGAPASSSNPKTVATKSSDPKVASNP